MAPKAPRHLAAAAPISVPPLPVSPNTNARPPRPKTATFGVTNARISAPGSNTVMVVDPPGPEIVLTPMTPPSEKSLEDP